MKTTCVSYAPVHAPNAAASSERVGRVAHVLFALAYAAVAVATIVLLGQGEGTPTDAGYEFDSRPEGVANLHSQSTSTAEAAAVVVAVLLCTFHSAMAYYAKALKSLGRGSVSLARLGVECLVLPLMVADLAVVVRIADAEKITTLVMLQFAVCLSDLAIEGVSRVVENLQTRFTKGDEHLDPPPETRFVGPLVLLGTFAVFLTAWVVLLTNAAWQGTHEGTSQNGQAAFWLSLGLFCVHRMVAYFALTCSLHREMLSLFLLLAMTCVISFVSL